VHVAPLSAGGWQDSLEHVRELVGKAGLGQDGCTTDLFRVGTDGRIGMPGIRVASGT